MFGVNYVEIEFVNSFLFYYRNLKNICIYKIGLQKSCKILNLVADTVLFLLNTISDLFIKARSVQLLF